MPSTDREVSKQAKVSLATADGPELRRRRPPKSTQGPTSPLPPPAFCPPRQPSRARLPAESWDLAHHKVWDPRACPASAGEAPAGAVQVLRAQPSGRHHLALTRQGTRTSAYAGGKAQNCSNLRQLTCLRPPAASLRPRPLRDAGFRQAATAARQPDPGRTAQRGGSSARCWPPPAPLPPRPPTQTGTSLLVATGSPRVPHAAAEPVPLQGRLPFRKGSQFFILGRHIFPSPLCSPSTDRAPIYHTRVM